MVRIRTDAPMILLLAPWRPTAAKKHWRVDHGVIQVPARRFRYMGQRGSSPDNLHAHAGSDERTGDGHPDANVLENPRVELALDILNVLDDTAEEWIATDN